MVKLLKAMLEVHDAAQIVKVRVSWVPLPSPTYSKVPCVESMVRVTVSLPSKIKVPLLLKVPAPSGFTDKL